MNEHTIRKRLAPTLALVPLLWAKLGAAQNIDFSTANCGNPPRHTFVVPLGQTFNGSVAAINAANPVAWAFDADPVFTNPADGSCTTSTVTSTCSGVVTTLPNAGNFTTDPVLLAGPPANSVPDGASVIFRLTAVEQTTNATCTREYALAFVGQRDIDLVLDRSGSMSLTSNISAPATNRYDALSLAVNGFLPLIQSTAPEGSQLGISMFASNVVQNVALAAIDPAAVSAVLAGQSPSGSTALGQGIAAALAKVPSAANRRGVILVFTDGEQNVAPLVNLDGQSLSDGTAIENRRIVTVGIGNPSGNYLTTLQNLAAENGGTMLITTNGSSFNGQDVGGAFTTAIAPLLTSSSPQLVAQFAGTVPTPPPPVVGVAKGAPPSKPLGPFAFSVNQGASELLIQLTVDRKLSPKQLASLLRGIEVQKGKVNFNKCQALDVKLPAVASNTAYLAVRLQKTKCGELEISGDYELKIPLPWLQDQGEGRGPTDVREFRLTPIVDDHLVDFESFVPEDAPTVGENFTPTVDLAYLDDPIEKARVVAKISVPKDDLGQVLATNPLVIQPSTGVDAGSPGFQKFEALLKDPKFLASIAPTDVLLPLIHRGNGRYSAPFRAGQNSGVYQVSYTVEAASRDFGRIQRIAAQSVYVRFGDVDPVTSNVTTQPADGGLVIRFRPLAKAIPGGKPKLLGPDQGDTFKIVSKGLKLAKVVDLQDGTYELALKGNPKADITFEVLGKPIYRGPADRFGKDKYTHGPHKPHHHRRHQFWHPGYKKFNVVRPHRPRKPPR